MKSAGLSICNPDGLPITSSKVDAWFKSQVIRVKRDRTDSMEEKGCVQEL